MMHYIYKCKHGRVISRCRCLGPHEIKIEECRAQACIRDEMNIKEGRHGTKATSG